MTLSIKVTDTDPLVQELRAMGANINKELGIAVWKTTRWAKSQAAKSAAQTINTKQSVLKKVMGAKRLSPTSAKVFVRTARSRKGLSIVHFRPRQTKTGVSAKAYFKGGGTQKFPNAFMHNGKVYERVGKGRMPIRTVRYPATVDTFIQKGLDRVLKLGIEQRLRDEINSRIRFLMLKASGKLRGKQPVEVK